MEPLILLIIVILFFVPTILMTRKQRKQQEEIHTLQNSLEIGDTVVTAGGLFGSVTAVKPDRVELEIAPGVSVEWDRAGILRREERVVSAEESQDAGVPTLPESEDETVETSLQDSRKADDVSEEPGNRPQS